VCACVSCACAVTTEIERYFVFPGQALSYYVGCIRFMDLRDKARKALGEQFDLKDFHAAVLLHGSLPLSLLDVCVDAYIARVKQTGRA
jgi:uncharacterized protein (DUF885 family)